MLSRHIQAQCCHIFYISFMQFSSIIIHIMASTSVDILPQRLKQLPFFVFHGTSWNMHKDFTPKSPYTYICIPQRKAFQNNKTLSSNIFKDYKEQTKANECKPKHPNFVYLPQQQILHRRFPVSRSTFKWIVNIIFKWMHPNPFEFITQWY